MVSQLARGISWPARTVASLLVLFALLLASPSEATMGNLVKVVYLHGALLRVAELAFAVAAVLGLLYLVRKSDAAVRWSWALQKTAFVCWLVSFLASLYLMSAAWGGINWSEPRFLSTGRVLSVAAIAIAIGFLLEKPRAIALGGVIVAAFVGLEVSSAGLVLHPGNPIGTSPSVALKLYYYGITLLTGVLALEVARLLLPPRKR